MSETVKDNKVVNLPVVLSNKNLVLAYTQEVMTVALTCEPGQSLPVTEYMKSLLEDILLRMDTGSVIR